ncbi:MAG: hypothetical protein KF810_01510 [Rhizobiaceae bacterium]|nr:hypothetical protein [Rhizobiaceae bacterium]
MTVSTKKPGFFRSVLNSLVESRQRQAELYVNGVLLALDDATLKSHGYERAALSKRGVSNRFCL